MTSLYSPYSGVRKAKAEVRYERRQFAMKHIQRVNRLAHKVKLNSVFGDHITVWVTAKRRVEWWPGSATWSTGSKGPGPDFQGEFDGFLQWMEDQPKVADPDDDFEVIE